MNEVGREGPGWRVWVCWRVGNNGVEGLKLFGIILGRDRTTKEDSFASLKMNCHVTKRFFVYCFVGFLFCFLCFLFSFVFLFLERRFYI